jgi:plasmid stabilization system protein ParE
MRCATNRKSISDVKADAAEVLLRVNEERQPILITQPRPATRGHRPVSGRAAPALYAVELTQGAERDPDEITAWVEVDDSPGRAAVLLDRVLASAAALGMSPRRGCVPRGRQALGIRNCRQAMSNPCRLICTVQEQARAVVFVVVVIADARRDMAALMQRRLLADLPRTDAT